MVENTDNAKRLPHLIVQGRADRQKFTAPPSGGGNKTSPTRNAAEHGKRLFAEFHAAVQSSVKQRQAAKAKGVRVTFESHPDAPLKLESLDLVAKGIELLSVKPMKEKVGETATLFIPEGKLTHFEKVFNAYASRPTKKGNPKNQELVAPIEKVRLPNLKDLWTETVPLPPQSEINWYELWLRRSEVDSFRKLAKLYGIQVADHSLAFVDRVVVVARCSLRDLSAVPTLLDCIAEVRQPPTPSSFFVDMPLSEQANWAKDLLLRVKFPNDDAPRVCLLDTGVNRAHPLLDPLVSAKDVQTHDSNWGTADHHGHGTGMAGLALYGDLAQALAWPGPVDITHRLESVKVLPPPPAQNQPPDYGRITKDCVARAEAGNPSSLRTVCMAVSDRGVKHRGMPTAWSAAIDQLAYGDVDGNEPKRLVVLAAGNLCDAHADLVAGDYPSSNQLASIHDPAQAWNALTVGAVADRDTVQRRGWQAVAKRGKLHPNSSTSIPWKPSDMVFKPDIVMAGGNVAHDGAGKVDGDVDLQLVTTSRQAASGRHFTTFGDTSAATALAARASASLMAAYPKAWPETIRGLLVHTAEWTQEMLGEFKPRKSRRNAGDLVRVYGFGVGNPHRARWSMRNALTLVSEEEIEPYEYDGGQKTKDMHLHRLPWPEDELRSLGPLDVRMRVTLSYFIEPHPSRRAFRKPHRYASHSLGFDVRQPGEKLAAFGKRVNKAARDEGEKGPPSAGYKKWVLGPDERVRGSIHSDIWHGSAAELADCGYVAVYPAMGWWRERAKKEGYINRKARYSLLISIETDDVNVDLYTPVANQLGIRIEV